MKISKPNILFYVLNFEPELTGCGKYSGELANWLNDKNVTCHIITTPPYYPEWKISKGYKQYTYAYESKRNLHISRCPILISGKGSFFSRIIVQLSFILSSLPLLVWKLVLYKPDFVFVVEPSFLCLPCAWAFKSPKSKIWLHIQDFEIQAACATGLIKNKFLINLLNYFEIYFMHKCDFISTISKSMQETLNSKLRRSVKTFFLPNWVTATNEESLMKHDEVQESLGLPTNKFIVLYSGNIGKKQELDTILETAKCVYDKSILFVICGDGVERERLIKASTEIKNILWLPLQEEIAFKSLLRLADVHVISQNNDIAGSVFPSKLLAILESGKPFFCISKKDTELGQIASKFGILVDSNTPTIIASELSKLKNNYSQFLDLAAKAKTWVLSEFEKESVLNKFLVKINEINN